MNQISPIKFDSLVSETVEALPKRTKQVIVRRFGLKNGRHETLEAVGGDYGITRERVRQIEADGLRQLSRPAVFEQLAPAFSYLEDHFADHGHVRREEDVLQHLAGEAHPHPKRQAIFFILTLGDQFSRRAEDEEFHTHWLTKEEALEKARGLIEGVVSHFEKHPASPVETEGLLELARSQAQLPEKVIWSYLGISKRVAKNVFGEYGLADWAEITPRGVRDKAYLVLKRAGEPLHFDGITSRINEAGFGPRRAYVQTVHNELIKDPRFVLVGRGLYALSDWGYAPGTVRDVLEGVLREKGPLAKDEILAEVLKRRLVKPNTVILNLQNPQIFIRLEDGRYSVAK